MRGSGIAALLLLLVLAAALSSCSAKPASLEWPRGSTAPAVDYNLLVLKVGSVSDIAAANSSGVLVLKVMDINGTSVPNATVFAFSSEEVVFDAQSAETGSNGTATFAFHVVAEPYEGMAVIASAMKPGCTDASILVQIVEETHELPVTEDTSAPESAAENALTMAALAVGIVSVSLYFYWSRGL